MYLSKKLFISVKNNVTMQKIMYLCKMLCMRPKLRRQKDNFIDMEFAKFDEGLPRYY